jgi:nitrile hydratase
MNGIHDLGGMHGHGPVAPEADEPVFHAPWERRAFAVMLAVFASGLYNVDEFRHAIERMDPADYLRSSYYEHWLHALETLLVEKGAIGASELSAAWAAAARGSA